MEKITVERYPAYKDSGVEWIGEVPEDWEVTSVKHLLSIPITDGPHTTPQLLDEGIPFISAEAIKNGEIDFEKKRGYISIKDHNLFSKKYRPSRGDVYMVKSGATTGNVAMVKTDADFSIWSPLAVFRANQNKISPEFLHLFLQSTTFKKGVELSWSFGTQQNIGMGILSNLPIAYGPLPEQTRIAAFLDRKTAQIDQAIAQKERLIELLKERRQILIQNAVTRGLNPDVKMKDSGVEWIGEVPEGWEVKKLKYLLNGRLKYGANEAGIEYHKDLPRYIRITDFGQEGRLIEENKLSLPWKKGVDYLLNDGDILFARSGATVGKTYQFKKSLSVEENYCYAGYLIKAEPNEAEIISDYLYLYTNSELFNKWKGAIFNKATIENIGADKYAHLFVIVPPISVQKEILEKFDSDDQKIATAITLKQAEIEKLKEYKSTLINSAVTGKIKV